MHDILPDQSPYWRWLEAHARQILAAYGYQEIRLPIVEKTELFQRAIGEVTDIVEKEMYTFDDRNGDSLTLRPEGTAGCVRACLEHGLLHNQTLRLWYQGPMFRHERPQKGRYRQFYQLGVETYGMPGPDIDIEIILLSHRLWLALGIRERVVLQLNSLGTAAERAAYREHLVAYLSQHLDVLDADSRRRLHTNPLRILDSKNPDLHAILQQAPVLFEHLGENSRRHFAALTQALDAAGVAYQINHRLVRGLDYYAMTVFEWVTDALGSQGAICAGGRYDGLVEQLGGKPNHAIGFAMGLERILALLELSAPVTLPPAADLYIIRSGEAAEQAGLLLAERIRDALPGLKVHLNCGGGSFKSQFKKADKSGALLAVIIGDDEAAKEQATLKLLRNISEESWNDRTYPALNGQVLSDLFEANEQKTLSQECLIAELTKLYNHL